MDKRMTKTVEKKSKNGRSFDRDQDTSQVTAMGSQQKIAAPLKKWVAKTKKSVVAKSKENDADAFDELFDRWEAEEFVPKETEVEVAVDSLESAIGYSSLFRQMHQSYLRMVAFHKADSGGKLSHEEARAKAFHPCTDYEEAKKKFNVLMRLPVESLHFVDLLELHSAAPRVAERLWERVKREGQKESVSGHLAANITFPVGYMKEVWNIARYQGVRSTFVAEWEPKGGSRSALST